MRGLKINLNSLIRHLFCIYLTIVLCYANSSFMRLVSLVILCSMFMFSIIQTILRYHFKLSLVAKNYIFFVVFALISYVWAVSTERYEAVLYELLTGLILIIIVDLNTNNQKNVVEYIKAFLFAVFFMSSVLLIRCNFDFMSLRNNGTQIIGLDKNYFSIIIVFAVIISYCFYRTSKNKLYLVCLPFYILVIVGSGSRKALLSIALGIGVMYVYAYRDNIKKLLRFIVLFTVLMIVLLIFIRSRFADLYNRVINGIAVFFLDTSSVYDTSASIRTLLIERGLDLFFSNPVLGVGMNNFSFFSGDINVYGGYMYAHNNYIEILADFGIIGFVIFYSMYCIFFYINKKHNKIFSDKTDLTVAMPFSIVILLLINDIASVSYYLKNYILLLLFAYKLIFIRGIKNEFKNKKGGMDR